MNRLIIALTLILVAPLGAAELLLVIGEPGTPEYAQALRESTADWQALATNGTIQLTVIGQDQTDTTNDLAALQTHLAAATNRSDALWIVLHGHGTYDGRNGRFNLRGRDITDKELKALLKPIDRPTALVCAFASGGVAFLSKLSQSNRVVVSATRAPSEDSYSHFGKYLAKAIGNPEADLDQDEAISLLEAWLHAARATAEFYLAEQRILTEHPLIDDNGDGKGSPLELFRGVRPTRADADGLRAHQLHLLPSKADAALSDEQRATRDRLELELFALRERKSELGADYWPELKTLLLKIGEIYDAGR